MRKKTTEISVLQTEAWKGFALPAVDEEAQFQSRKTAIRELLDVLTGLQCHFFTVKQLNILQAKIKYYSTWTTAESAEMEFYSIERLTELMKIAVVLAELKPEVKAVFGKYQHVYLEQALHLKGRDL